MKTIDIIGPRMSSDEDFLKQNVFVRVYFTKTAPMGVRALFGHIFQTQHSEVVI